MAKHTEQFDVIVFDLGGVLIRNAGEEKLVRWLGGKHTVPEIWGKWLASPAVRAYESGATDTPTFAAAIVKELKLPVAPDAFAVDFATWPVGFYPGAEEILKALKPRFRLACLSNCNPAHWPTCATGVTKYITEPYLSYETGLLKPDREVYLHLIKGLKCPAERILFFDDNQVNIDAAAACGINSHLTRGAEEVRITLERLGIL